MPDIKFCSKCEVTKPKQDFAKNQVWCRDCKKEYDRKHYEKVKEQKKARAKERRKEIQEWFQEYKRTLECKLCPETHPACLEFHHRDPTEKDNVVSNLALRGYSKERVLEEIAKCDVLCANCHRKLHNDW